jgi:Methylpurine-DNA glycosylase (MPG)
LEAGFGKEIGTDARAIAKKLNVLSMLVCGSQDDATEEEFVALFSRSFIGRQEPHAVGTLGRYGAHAARAIKSKFKADEIRLFARTGLQIPTCRKLFRSAKKFWVAWSRDDTAAWNLSASLIRDLADVAFKCADSTIAPTKLTTARTGEGSRGGTPLGRDSEFLAEWITEGASPEIYDRYFGFISDSDLRAEAYTDYTEQTLGFRAPWLLRAFVMFSKYIWKSENLSVGDSELGRERGIGAGVLVRALEPVEGIDLMKERRGPSSLRDLARGPGRLTLAMAIDSRYDGVD